MDIIKEWLFEYCCKMKYRNAIKELKLYSQNLVMKNPRNLSLFVIHDIIVNSFEISRFPITISIVNDLYDAMPPDCVSFTLYLKIITGLKLLTVLDLLKSRNKNVLPQLNTYFPRTGLQHPKALTPQDKKSEELVNCSQLPFRKLVMTLVSEREKRKDYFENTYKLEYGPDFQNKVKTYTIKFIENVEKRLPDTHIEMLIRTSNGSNLNLLKEMEKLQSPTINLMFDMIYEQQKLSEKDVLEILTKIDKEVQMLENSETSRFSSQKSVLQTSAQSYSFGQRSREDIKQQCDKTKHPPSLVKFCMGSGDMLPPGMNLSYKSLNKSKVPLTKVYKMNFKSNKINRSMKDLLSQSTSSSYTSIKKYTQNGVAETINENSIPDQVQAVSSSSDPDSQPQNPQNQSFATLSQEISQEDHIAYKQTENIVRIDENDNTTVSETVDRELPIFHDHTNETGQKSSAISHDTSPKSNKLNGNAVNNNNKIERILKNELGSINESSCSTASVIETMEDVSCDSDESQSVLASSHSSDQFEVLLDAADAVTNLPLKKHIKSDDTKLCVVKLFRRNTMEDYFMDRDGILYDIYN